ncbi:MAG: glycosyltransferase, partial [Vicinamibacterales bacterium]|nr:glycosyltransferase [Vicinamibacterales bacterium]
RAIKSVLGQSHADFELLVVDDGSVDGTEHYVASCRDARVRYIRHEQNRGQNAALNTGLEGARGTFVSFLDSDDEWDAGMLEAVIGKFRSDGELGWVHTAFRVKSTTGAVEPHMGSTLEGWVYREALEEGAVSPPTTLSVRRTCFDTVGPFDLDVVVGQDDVMCLKLARSFKAGRVNDVLATIHCDGGDRVSQDQALAAEGYYRLHEKFRADIVAHFGRARMAQHYTHAGRLFLDVGHRRMAFIAHLKSLAMGACPSAIPRIGFSLLPRRWQQRVWDLRHRQ